MQKKKSNGEGSIITTTLNGKPYYKASVTIGFDSAGKQIKRVLVVIKNQLYWRK